VTTEVYSCKEGQALKAGKLDYAPHITDKEQAAADALRRCQRDPSFKKIVYYKVSPDGDFRLFYSYANPNCKPAAKPISTAGKMRPTPKKKTPEKLGLIARITKALGF
jgi:hypothetical protein